MRTHWSNLFLLFLLCLVAFVVVVGLGSRVCVLCCVLLWFGSSCRLLLLCCSVLYTISSSSICNWPYNNHICMYGSHSTHSINSLYWIQNTVVLIVLNIDEKTHIKPIGFLPFFSSLFSYFVRCYKLSNTHMNEYYFSFFSSFSPDICVLCIQENTAVTVYHSSFHTHLQFFLSFFFFDLLRFQIDSNTTILVEIMSRTESNENRSTTKEEMRLIWMGFVYIL